MTMTELLGKCYWNQMRNVGSHKVINIVILCNDVVVTRGIVPIQSPMNLQNCGPFETPFFIEREVRIFVRLVDPTLFAVRSYMSEFAATDLVLSFIDHHLLIPVPPL